MTLIKQSKPTYKLCKNRHQKYCFLKDRNMKYIIDSALYLASILTIQKNLYLSVFKILMRFLTFKQKEDLRWVFRDLNLVTI